MDIVITQWALDSYLSLIRQNVFSKQDYWQTIRPDVELLKTFPADPKFTVTKFWSPAQDPSGGPRSVITDGYKMKWRNLGNGKIQLRLPVGMFTEAFLCEAYVKTNTKTEMRMLARFKTQLQKIRNGAYTERGRLK